MIEPLPMPSKGQEILVIPIHIGNIDLMYVQFSDWITRFEDFQFNTLQATKAQELGYIPSKLNTFSSLFECQF